MNKLYWVVGCCLLLGGCGVESAPSSLDCISCDESADFSYVGEALDVPAGYWQRGVDEEGRVEEFCRDWTETVAFEGPEFTIESLVLHLPGLASSGVVAVSLEAGDVEYAYVNDSYPEYDDFAVDDRDPDYLVLQGEGARNPGSNDGLWRLRVSNGCEEDLSMPFWSIHAESSQAEGPE